MNVIGIKSIGVTVISIIITIVSLIKHKDKSFLYERAKKERKNKHVKIYQSKRKK